MNRSAASAGSLPYRRLVLPVYVPSLLLAISEGVLIPVLPLYARGFGISYGLIGLIVAGPALGTLLADVPSGMLLKRVGTRMAMVAGMTIMLVSILALYWARSIPEAVLYRVLTGVGGAMFNVARHAYLADIVRVASRGRAISLQGGIFRLGRLVGPALGGIMASALGLRVPFLFVGTMCAIATVLVALFGKAFASPSPQAAALPGVAGHSLWGVIRARYRVLTAAGTGHLLAQMIRAGRTVAVPLYANDVLGLDIQVIGFIESVSRTVDVAMFWPAGQVMDRLGRKFAIVPSFLIQTLGMAFVPLTGNIGQLLAATCLYSVGNGLGSGSMMTLGADLAPEDARGEFLGVWRLIGDAGASGGPLAVGGVADLMALPAAIWVISAAGLVASAVFAFFVPETLRRTKARPASPADPPAG